MSKLSKAIYLFFILTITMSFNIQQSTILETKAIQMQSFYLQLNSGDFINSTLECQYSASAFKICLFKGEDNVQKVQCDRSEGSPKIFFETINQGGAYYLKILLQNNFYSQDKITFSLLTTVNGEFRQQASRNVENWNNNQLQYPVKLNKRLLQSTCGNSILQTGQLCDNNGVNGDGCTSSCTIQANYACYGALGSTSSCIVECGNGIRISSQVCDDGNVVNGDGCSSTCTVETGYDCTGNLGSKSSCIRFCGNGIINSGEICDDGNIVNGDGCTSTCTVETNYVCNGNEGSKSTCTLQICGDGKRNATQQCDDGGIVNQDGCSSLCMFQNGYICTGNFGSRTTCILACGNGILNSGQECDNGNGVGCTTGCIPNIGYYCTKVIGQLSVCSTSCGDNIRAGSEVCDNGNKPGCSQNCVVDQGYTCSGSLGQPSKCCLDGFTLVSGVCQRCNPLCLTCLTGLPNSCTSCTSLYQHSQDYNLCYKCLSPCLTCQPLNNSFCLTCLPPFSIYPNSLTGSCYRCNQESCLYCNQLDTNICLSCMSGWSLNGTVCTKCSLNCEQCVLSSSDSSINSCVACQAGFSLNNSQCLKCSYGCLYCNSGLCQICFNGFYLQIGVCKKCSAGCLTCATANTCLQYEQGLVLYNSQISQCNIGCKSCNSANPLICTECFKGFYLASGGICLQCGAYCQECLNENNCIKCSETTFPYLVGQNTQCRTCKDANCIICNPTDLNWCLSCKNGFRLNQQGVCSVPCSEGCNQCPSDPLVCTNCKNNYALTNSGKCMKCISGCNGACDIKDPNICLSCSVGFYLVNNQCKRCSFGCLKCLNSQECLQCPRSHNLVQKLVNGSNTYICQKKCLFPCTKCSQNICQQCSSGYTLNSTKCIPDLSCNQGSTCSICLSGTYAASAGTCSLCISNCSVCSSPQNCHSCFKGFYLSIESGIAKCRTCDISCRVCKGLHECSQCNDGYVKELLLGTDPNLPNSQFSQTCILCDSNCRTCETHRTRCSSCHPGFKLNDTRCVGFYAVSFTLKLNTNYQTYIQNSQSQVLLQKLAQISKRPKADISLISIKEGSVIVSGAVSTESEGTAFIVHTLMSSSIYPSSNILGVNILSSAMVITHNDQAIIRENRQQKINIPLIVGLTCSIGGAIVILVIVFVIYKKVLKKKEVEPEENIINPQEHPRVDENVTDRPQLSSNKIKVEKVKKQNYSIDEMVVEQTKEVFKK